MKGTVPKYRLRLLEYYFCDRNKLKSISVKKKKRKAQVTTKCYENFEWTRVLVRDSEDDGKNVTQCVNHR